MMRVSAVFLLGLLLSFAAAKARATEHFTLANGGQLTGELLNPDQIPRETYKIRTPDGVTVTLDSRLVQNRTQVRPALEEYARRKPEYPDTVEGQFALAQWCRENNLYTQRKIHLNRVIELEPDHADARRMLGYVQIEPGKWATQEDIMESRGFVKYRGRWRLPQEIKLIEQRRKQELAEKEWFRKIKLWRSWIVNGNTQAQQAVQRIRTVDDPLAIPALKQKLEEEPFPEIRLLYVHALSRIDTIEANELLANRFLSDEHREVRLTCLDYMVDDPQPEILAMLIQNLRSKDNGVINQAAYGLKELGDESAVAPLIDALVTEHKFKQTIGNPGGGMSFTFGGASGGSGGSGFNGTGMSAGGKTQIIAVHKANPLVLEALVELTGQNFNYNMPAWKAWFAGQKAPESLNARRD